MITNTRVCPLMLAKRRERAISSRPEDFPEVLRDMAVCLASLSTSCIARGYGHLLVDEIHVRYAIDRAVEDLKLIAETLERQEVVL